MASHFSSIGLRLDNKDDFMNYFKLSYENGESIQTEDGRYVKWTIDNKVELYGQLDNNNSAIGLNPHFSGESKQIVKIEKFNKCSNDTILDGGFVCWADPQQEGIDGIFPFVFDCPDVSIHKNISLPQNVEVQIAAFAHEIHIYDNTKNLVTHKVQI